MTVTKLRAVPDEPQPPTDIYAAWRAQIASRNWERVHIAGDKREPVELRDGRGGWRV